MTDTDASDKPGSTKPDDGYRRVDLAAEQIESIVALLDATALPDVTNARQLSDAVLALVKIRFQGFAPSGVRLLELNRRYGVLASRFGVTIRDIIIKLTKEGILFTQVYKDSFVCVPKDAYNKYMKEIFKDGRNVIEEAELILRRSFPQDVPGKVTRKRRATKSLSDL